MQQEPGLIESLLWDGEYHRIGLHVGRMVASADELGFPVAPERINALLAGVAAGLGAGDYKVRVLLERTGELWGSAEPLETGTANAEVMVARTRLPPADHLTRHKTTRRTVFDAAARFAAAQGLADILFLNRFGELTEAANSNVFVRLGGELLTPRKEAGLLAGTFRATVLEDDDRAREELLTLADLLQAEKIFLCNSVRGWREVGLRAGRAEF